MAHKPKPRSADERRVYADALRKPKSDARRASKKAISKSYTKKGKK